MFCLRRKFWWSRSEVCGGGMQAMYGDLRSWKRELAADVAASATAPPFDTAEQNPSPSHAATNGAHPPGNSARGEPDGAAAASDGAAPDRQRSGASSSGHASSSHGAYAPVDTAAAAAAAAEAGCLDVTLALQFQVQDSEARLSAAACKGSLLGFADLAPEGRKHLYVAYRHGETLYETEGARHSRLRRFCTLQACCIAARVVGCECVAQKRS